MDGIAGVQARISEIVSRFQAPPTAAGTLGAAETAEVSAFAAQLAEAAVTSAPASSSAPVPTGTLNAAGVDPVQWSRDFLEALGMPVTPENMRAMNAWQQAEGTRARFNPLATTQNWDGATQFNSVGVKNFASYDDGLAANLKVINNGRYGNILAALRKGTSAMEVAEAIKSSPWGSGDLVAKILQR